CWQTRRVLSEGCLLSIVQPRRPAIRHLRMPPTWQRGDSFVVVLESTLKKAWRNGRRVRPGGRGRPPLHNNPHLHKNRRNSCSAQLRFFSHGGELCCIQQHGDDKKTFVVTEVIWAAGRLGFLLVMCL